MDLHIYMPLPEFIRAWSEPGFFRLRLADYLSSFPEGSSPHGFALLREAFARYEKEYGIPAEASKRAMPFLRENQLRMVGPEVSPFACTLYEGEEVPEGVQAPAVALSLDYGDLAEYCLMENLFLLRCKYGDEANIRHLQEGLRQEYGKVFFDRENTGFAPGSRFFSLLCNAALEMEPGEAPRRAWRLAALVAPEEADYECCGGALRASLPVRLPAECIRRVRLVPDYRTQPVSYTHLIGFLKKQGLAPERVLEGLIEPDES